MDKPLYDTLNELSRVSDLPVGRLMRLAVVDYIRRLELGQTDLPLLGESMTNPEGVSGVIKKYREVSQNRIFKNDKLPPPAPLADQLKAIDARLAKMEQSLATAAK